VIDHYNAGGEAIRETTKLFIKPLNLTQPEKSDLISFLRTLDSADATNVSFVLNRHQKGKP